MVLLQRIFVLLFDDSSLFSFASWSLGLHRAAFPLVIGRRSAGRPHFLISPISRDYLKIVKIESWNMNRCRCYRLKEDQAICLFVGRDGKDRGRGTPPAFSCSSAHFTWMEKKWQIYYLSDTCEWYSIRHVVFPSRQMPAKLFSFIYNCRGALALPS